MDADWVQSRINGCQQLLSQLLASPKIPFNENMHSRLPIEHGLYAISRKDAEACDVPRAGRTKTAGGGLRQRIYQNHLMGNQTGNLCSQLIRDGVAGGFPEARTWIRKNCVVQFIVVKDDRLRMWAEYFMLSVLRPRHCD
jgi:hypothetical protein